jgi:hypothetical protein
LRLAGLVQLTFGEDKEDRRYAARIGAVAAVCDSLKRFLSGGDTEHPEDE